MKTTGPDQPFHMLLERLNRELLKSLVEPYGPDVARQLEVLSSSYEL